MNLYKDYGNLSRRELKMHNVLLKYSSKKLKWNTTLDIDHGLLIDKEPWINLTFEDTKHQVMSTLLDLLVKIIIVYEYGSSVYMTMDIHKDLILV